MKHSEPSQAIGGTRGDGLGGLGPILNSQGCEKLFLRFSLNERCRQRGRKHNENEAKPQTKKTYAVKWDPRPRPSVPCPQNCLARGIRVRECFNTVEPLRLHLWSMWIVVPDGFEYKSIIDNNNNSYKCTLRNVLYEIIVKIFFLKYIIKIVLIRAV